jgi:hypothetical protein
MKSLATILALLFLLLLSMPLLAQESEDPNEIEADPEVEAVDDEKATEMLEELKAAEKSREVPKIMATLEKFITSRNGKFLKPLRKTASHKVMAVRIQATKAIGSQEPVKKVGPALWKIYKSPQNKKIDAVRAAAISSMRRVKFDSKNVMKELEGEFKKASSTEVMRECVRYFGDLKKAEMVRWLVDWVEAPQPASVNSASNPPAAYWERMWKIWEKLKVPVREALIKITSRDYETERQWRVWLDSDEARRMGAD